MELTEPPSEIYLNLVAELGENGVALRYTVKLHLENPLLGRDCYIGSDTDPIVFNLTTGETNPPPPNKPIHGAFGKITTSEEERIRRHRQIESTTPSRRRRRADAAGSRDSTDPTANLYLTP